MSSSDHPSSLLFHGPSAQGRAAAAAAAWGHVIGVFGDPSRGLDAETARLVASTMASTTPGDKQGSIIVGPVDVVTVDGIEDALLKSLEDFGPTVARPFLWAWDGGSVRPTIRSRCLLIWCPGQVRVDREITEAAKETVQASLSGSVAGVIESLREVSSDARWRDVGQDFLQAVAEEVARAGTPAHLRLWERVRDLYLRRDVPAFSATMTRFIA